MPGCRTGGAVDRTVPRRGCAGVVPAAETAPSTRRVPVVRCQLRYLVLWLIRGCTCHRHRWPLPVAATCGRETVLEGAASLTRCRPCPAATNAAVGAAVPSRYRVHVVLRAVCDASWAVFPGGAGGARPPMGMPMAPPPMGGQWHGGRPPAPYYPPHGPPQPVLPPQTHAPAAAPPPSSASAGVCVAGSGRRGRDL